MRHRVAGRVAVFVTGVLLGVAGVGAADDGADLSSPRKTAAAFAMALQRGDMATLQTVTVGGADDYKLMRSVTGMTAAADQLNKAAVARFGAEEGKKVARSMGGSPEQSDIPRQIAESDEKVEGDSAAITMKGAPPGNAINLKKVEGRWKVDLSQFPKRDEIARQTPILDAAAKVLVQGAADVRNGKYRTAEEAGQEIQRQVNAVSASVSRQQSPAAPARPPTTQRRN